MIWSHLAIGFCSVVAAAGLMTGFIYLLVKYDEQIEASIEAAAVLAVLGVLLLLFAKFCEWIGSLIIGSFL